VLAELMGGERRRDRSRVDRQCQIEQLTEIAASAQMAPRDGQYALNPAAYIPVRLRLELLTLEGGHCPMLLVSARNS